MTELKYNLKSDSKVQTFNHCNNLSPMWKTDVLKPDMLTPFSKKCIRKV